MVACRARFAGNSGTIAKNSNAAAAAQEQPNVEIILTRVLKIDDGRPGDIFGEVGFAGTHVARSARVRAVSAVAAVRIESDRVHKGLRFYPRIATRLYRNISAILGSRLLDSHQRLLRVSPDSSQAGRNSSHPAGD